MATNKMTPAKIERERKRLKERVSEAQYDYNCAFDGRIEANRRWLVAKNEMDAATEHRAGSEIDFDDAETRLFGAEEILDSFNHEYPED